MTPDPAPAETLKLLSESTPVLRFVYISALLHRFSKWSVRSPRAPREQPRAKA